LFKSHRSSKQTNTCARPITLTVFGKNCRTDFLW